MLAGHGAMSVNPRDQETTNEAEAQFGQGPYAEYNDFIMTCQLYKHMLFERLKRQNQRESRAASAVKQVNS